MRLIIAALLMMMVGCASSSELPAELSETVVVEEHSLSKTEAFSRVLRWVRQTYPARDAVSLTDADSGTIIVQGEHRVSRYGGIGQYPLSYTMTLDVREGRLRFTQTVGEPLDPQWQGGVSAGDAEQLNAHFADLRASALAALRAEDDF